MADLVITAAEVLAAAGAVEKIRTAAETITQGDVYYLDSTASDQAKKSDADASDAASVGKGIALSAAGTGQKFVGLEGGNIDPGGTTVVGETYVVSGTAGKMAPIADLTNPDRLTIVGIATSTSNLETIFKSTKVTRAS